MPAFAKETLPERDDRLEALREAWRVLHADGAGRRLLMTLAGQEDLKL